MGEVAVAQLGGSSWALVAAVRELLPRLCPVRMFKEVV
jgi:hypothetical protein